MRILAVSLGLILWPILSAAFEIEDQRLFGPQDAATTLRVISTADTDVFAPVVISYLADAPGVAVDYVVASSEELMKAIAEENAPFDVAISSAMNLQTKLANDGHARAHRSSVTEGLPDWARWRDHLFAFTREPAALVLSPAAFADIGMPKSRQDLIALLRQYPDRFRGRIGTYDVRISGLGYLFATQDARTSETYWRLTEVMGLLDTRLYCCSSAMIDDLASGDLAVAYNVLGSYAHARDDADEFAVIYPEDFTTVMLRTAMIPKNVQSVDAATQFLDHLLRIAWQGKETQGYDFDRLTGGDSENLTNYRYIRLGPGLLVHLDGFKKQSFLKAWENAVLQD